MALAIFDLDHTILEGDSDQLWGDFLSEQGLVDPTDYQNAKNRFYQDYLDGTLDVFEFLEFCASALARFSAQQLTELEQTFFQDYVASRIRPKGRAAVEAHRNQGDTCLVITATNNFLANAATQNLPVDAIIASELERKNDVFTGKVVGIPSFQEGKVHRLNTWLENQPHTYETATFYSDSHNDLPLLRRVGYPVAVTPDDELRRIANKHQWTIVDWRI